MEEEAKITIYKITACGYYKRGEPATQQFGGINETLQDLRKWIAGKQLGETKTYSATEDSRPPTYVVDVTDHIGNGLLDCCVIMAWWRLFQICPFGRAISHG